MLAYRPAPAEEHHRTAQPPTYRPTTSTSTRSAPVQSSSSSSRPLKHSASSTRLASSTTTATKPSLASSTAHPPPPPPPPAAPSAAADKPKSDKGKLTEQWGPPPNLIRRDNDWLQRGQLLGEGGFARVYLSTEPDGVTTKALKVIAKEQLKSTKNKSKLFGEIKIHQAMQHPNIVSFEHCFEDEGNVYMQLELCSNGSLLDLLRRRRRYSEPEARFYLVQLIGACDYMHSNSVIHRDLKLGNLMLDEEMNLRVGDFGLAALVKFPGERKKTICGTPNYIAPEILFDTTNGHSFEVDIWSIGVILYTLLVGKPPFQTKDVKNIYRKIKDNSYAFPPDLPLSHEAMDLISSILTTSPDQRPTLHEILQHDFFTTGPFPPSISPASMDSVPDYRQMSVRASHRNFRSVMRRCGIEEPVEGASAAPVQQVQAQVQKTALQAVNEEEVEVEEEEKARQPRRVAPVPVQARTTTATASKEVRGMEKEVKQVLAPESPISELLRSARKPLMVSPSSTNPTTALSNVAEPHQLLQRKLLAEARANPPAARSSRPPVTTGSKENAPPLAREKERAVEGKHRRSVLGVSSATAALSPSQRGNGVTVPAPLLPSKSEVVPSSARLPARELYETTWRTLDHALTLQPTSSSSLSAIPSPPSPEPPKVFITSWVDYTHKYGTAYSLTDGTAGLYFNDSTTMVLSPDKSHFDYISQRTSHVYTRRHYSLTTRPDELARKAYLLSYFEDYMAKTLTRDVEWTWSDEGRKRNMDFLVKYYRMKSAIVFKLSNEVLQFNFYDHTKLLLTHSGTLLTFIDQHFHLTTYSLPELMLEAYRLGYFSPKAKVLDERKAKRLEQVRFLCGKLEYCRDVLRSLSLRKSSSTTTTATATSGVPI
ncbi:hypothetical protein BCR35DRAFT_297802 [Leucosporidium creatinivorum]|uniref:Serine/threonine-protein kinase n=1 Tax=Leucosporidium creatinivorum TaxID=106004 RepID=A0A1Y2G379_9BASI|nr:hypothetical protein BCR35DRAFT_297802 [Leucosporidium creatinivorum]